MKTKGMFKGGIQEQYKKEICLASTGMAFVGGSIIGGPWLGAANAAYNYPTNPYCQ